MAITFINCLSVVWTASFPPVYILDPGPSVSLLSLFAFRPLRSIQSRPSYVTFVTFGTLWAGRGLVGSRPARVTCKMCQKKKFSKVTSGGIHNVTPSAKCFLTSETIVIPPFWP